MAVDAPKKYGHGITSNPCVVRRPTENCPVGLQGFSLLERVQRDLWISGACLNLKAELGLCAVGDTVAVNTPSWVPTYVSVRFGVALSSVSP